MFFENKISIKVENVSKSYGLYKTPNDRLKQFIFPNIQKIFNLERVNFFTEFLALNGVNFQIKKGETVGIIGRNGSGKSTLLQVLCGTLAPNRGYVDINGRIAALLELGTGFNLEYSGRENIYMNANILGLNKSEIDKCYKDIVSFADIGDFINQPVKLYSSGMYVRLAFAVIAHVNADILIIDEALAVGDIFFTHKCMTFLRKFKEKGTILFVSHDPAAVKNLCSRVIWLDKGRIIMDGKPKDVCDLYYQDSLQATYGNEIKLDPLQKKIKDINITKQENIEQIPYEAINYESIMSVQDNTAMATGWKTSIAEIVEITLSNLDNNNNKINGVFEGGERVRVTIRAKALSELKMPILGFIIKDRLGQELFGENTLAFNKNPRISAKPGQEIRAEFVFKLPMLQDGQYAVMTSLADGDLYNHVHHHYIHDALILNVNSSKIRYGIVGVSFDSVLLEIGSQTSV